MKKIEMELEILSTVLKTLSLSEALLIYNLRYFCMQDMFKIIRTIRELVDVNIDLSSLYDDKLKKAEEN